MALIEDDITDSHVDEFGSGMQNDSCAENTGYT